MPVIHYLTPFSTTLNIGGEYNARISELQSDSYICVRDGDTMFLLPDWGQQVEQIIQENPEYSLITCMTNRVGVQSHCVPGMFDVDSIAVHIDKAKEIKSTACVKTNVAPGLCMIFHKSVWEKNQFKDNSIFFDKVFSANVTKNGGKIGLATGLYLLHLYRYGQESPKSYTAHLK